MRKFLLAAPLLGLLLALPVLAQGPGPGPGPGPTPSPWTVNGNSISYPGGVEVGSPSGGSEGAGTINAQAYYLNGVQVTGMPKIGSPDLLCNTSGSSALPIDCTWNTYASAAIGTVTNSLPFYSGGVWGHVVTGSSVANPGTGTLESLLPVQTSVGASKVFATSDLFWETRRSNSGSAMTDTFPAITATGIVNGTRITYNNVDATATATITAGAGTTMSSGGPTDTVPPGRSILYVYDATATEWRRSLNTGSALITLINGSGPTSGYTAGQILSSNGTVLSAYSVSGTGSTVALTVSPSFTTPALGAATATSVTVSGVVITSSGIAMGGDPITGASSIASAVADIGGGTQVGILTVNMAADNALAAVVTTAGNGRVELGTDGSNNAYLRSANNFNLLLDTNSGSNGLSINGTTGAVTILGPSFTATGLVTYADLVPGTSNQVLGYWGSTTASATPVPNCAGALTFSTTSSTFGCNSSAGTGTVTTTGSPTAFQVAIMSGTTSITGVGPGTLGQALISQGSANPTYAGGAWVLLATLTGSTISDTTHITSAYNEYVIVFENLLPGTTNVTCEIQVHAGGVFVTTGYSASSLRFSATTASVLSATTYVPCDNNNGALTNSGSGLVGEFTLYSPSQTSSPKTIVGTYSESGASGGMNWGSWTGGNNAVDGFQVIPSSGTWASGTVKLYGRL